MGSRDDQTAVDSPIDSRSELLAERDLQHELSLRRLERFATSFRYFQQVSDEYVTMREILESLKNLDDGQVVDYFDKFAEIEERISKELYEVEEQDGLLDSVYKIQASLVARQENIRAEQAALNEAQNARLDRLETALRKIRDGLASEPLSDKDLQDYVLQAVDDLIDALTRRSSAHIEAAYARLALAEREEQYVAADSKDRSRIKRIGYHALIALGIIGDIASYSSLYLAISEREQKPIADLVYELDEQPQIGPGHSGQVPALEPGDS